MNGKKQKLAPERESVCHWSMLLCSVSKSVSRTDSKGGQIEKKNQSGFGGREAKFHFLPENTNFYKKNQLFLGKICPLEGAATLPPSTPLNAPLSVSVNTFSSHIIY